MVLTDWLSMIAPLGVASRPSLSRTMGRSASNTRSQVPSLRHFRKYHQTVPQGGRSWGIIRQEIPPRNTYRMPFTTSRRCTVRGCPLGETVGNRGSSKPHWASVKSVGYALRSIPQSYRLPANHTKLFQCKFRQLSHTLLGDAPVVQVIQSARPGTPPGSRKTESPRSPPIGAEYSRGFVGRKEL